jgi:magnesium-transporting ATPase (P-type)
MALLPIGAALFFGWPESPLPASGSDVAVLSTMVFSAIVLMQIANAFECRSNPASLFSIGPLSNPLLLGAVTVEALVLLTFVYLPPVQRVLGHDALDFRQWALVLVTPLILLGAEEARKAFVRARARS